jgi:hypothetical protein
MKMIDRPPRQVLRMFSVLAAALLMAAALCLASASAQKPHKALTKDEVLELLNGAVPSARVADIARERGIEFPMTRGTESQLREAGASPGLLKVLRELAPRPPVAPTSAPEPSVPAPSAGPPVLLIEATPGGAQAYVDDEPVGTTSSEGRLKLTRLAPGEHKVRLSLAGYRSYEQSVELSAGQTTTVAASLEAAQTQVVPPSEPARVSTQTGATANEVAVGGSTRVASFAVAHDHGAAGSDYCLGVMAIGNGMIQYRSANGLHSFDFPLGAVKEAKKNDVYLAALGAFHIRLKKGANYNFVQVNSAGQYQQPDALLGAIDRAIGKQ